VSEFFYFFSESKSNAKYGGESDFEDDVEDEPPQKPISKKQRRVTNLEIFFVVYIFYFLGSDQSQT